MIFVCGSSLFCIGVFNGIVHLKYVNQSILCQFDLKRKHYRVYPCISDRKMWHRMGILPQVYHGRVA